MVSLDAGGGGPVEGLKSVKVFFRNSGKKSLKFLNFPSGSTKKLCKKKGKKNYTQPRLYGQELRFYPKHGPDLSATTR